MQGRQGGVVCMRASCAVATFVPTRASPLQAPPPPPTSVEGSPICILHHHTRLVGTVLLEQHAADLHIVDHGTTCAWPLMRAKGALGMQSWRSSAQASLPSDRRRRDRNRRNLGAPATRPAPRNPPRLQRCRLAQGCSAIRFDGETRADAPRDAGARVQMVILGGHLVIQRQTAHSGAAAMPLAGHGGDHPAPTMVHRRRTPYIAATAPPSKARERACPAWVPATRTRCRRAPALAAPRCSLRQPPGHPDSQPHSTPRRPRT